MDKLPFPFWGLGDVVGVFRFLEGFGSDVDGYGYPSEGMVAEGTDGVGCAWGDVDELPRLHRAGFASHHDLSLSLQYVVDFFGVGVEVRLEYDTLGKGGVPDPQETASPIS